jgi:hypothetical protein
MKQVKGYYGVIFYQSEAVDRFFEEAAQSHHDFWNLFHEWDVADAHESDGDRCDPETLFDRGLSLGLQADHQPICKWERNHGGRGYTVYYFIGEEASVLCRLEIALEDMLKKRPNKDEETLKRERLERDKERVAKAVAIAQAKLKKIETELNNG